MTRDQYHCSRDGEVNTGDTSDVVTADNQADKIYCEAQGKGRAKGGPRKVTQRSFMDGGWWMVVYLSLMLYTKFG